MGQPEKNIAPLGQLIIDCGQAGKVTFEFFGFAGCLLRLSMDIEHVPPHLKQLFPKDDVEEGLGINIDLQNMRDLRSWINKMLKILPKQGREPTLAQRALNR